MIIIFIDGQGQGLVAIDATATLKLTGYPFITPDHIIYFLKPGPCDIAYSCIHQ